MRKALLCALLLVVPLIFSVSAFAAANASAAVQTQQDMVAEKHVEHSGAGVAAGRRGTAVGAGNAMAWTAFPTLKIKMGGEGRERRIATVVPQGIAANSIDAYSNDIKDAKGHRQLPLEMAGAKLDKPAVGGFHWLSAREVQDDKVKVASTVHFFSERGGQNPTVLFMQQKHELEIIPQPYPREHSRYRSNEDWKFLVRFNGKPFAGQSVRLETQNGTKADLVSDAQGVITVHLPNDFNTEAEQKSADGHSHGRRSSDFVLATEHAEGGKNYLTAFNASYGKDAFDQRSLAMGLGFMLLGMIGAAPLLRQHKGAKPGADAKSAATETVKNEDA